MEDMRERFVDGVVLAEVDYVKWYVTRRLHLAKSGVKNQTGLAQLSADISSFFHLLPCHAQRL